MEGGEWDRYEIDIVDNDIPGIQGVPKKMSDSDFLVIAASAA